MSIISQTRRFLLPQQLSLITQKRFNQRETIHRYVEPNKFKKHMLSAAQPYFRTKFLKPEEKCLGVPVNVNEMSPLDAILKDELVEDIKNSDFTLFLQYNWVGFQSDRVYRNTITHKGGKFHALSNIVYKEAFKILNQESVQCLFVTRNALITGRLESVASCVNALKKMPQLLLLAGIIENHTYNFDQLNAISATTNIDQCRANLLSILDTPAIELSDSLQRHNEMLKTTEGKETPPESPNE